MSSWQSRAGTEDGTDWMSSGASGRGEDTAEGESKNRNRESTECKIIKKILLYDRSCRNLHQNMEEHS